MRDDKHITLWSEELEEKRLLTLYRDPSRRLCEIRWDCESRKPVERTRAEQRLFLQLEQSTVAVNVWITMLGPIGDTPLGRSMNMPRCCCIHLPS